MKAKFRKSLITALSILALTPIACDAKKTTTQLDKPVASTNSQSSENSDNLEKYKTALLHENNVKETKFNLLQFYRYGLMTDFAGYSMPGFYDTYIEPQGVRNIALVLNKSPATSSHPAVADFTINPKMDRESLLSETKVMSDEDLRKLDNYFYSPCFDANILDPNNDMGLTKAHIGGIDSYVLGDYFAMSKKDRAGFDPAMIESLLIPAFSSPQSGLVFGNSEFQKLYTEQCVHSEARKNLAKAIDEAGVDGVITLDEFKQLDAQRLADMVKIKEVFKDYAKTKVVKLEWPKSKKDPIAGTMAEPVFNDPLGRKYPKS